MTQTTATRIYTIPNTGLATTVGDVTIEVRPHSHAGYLVQARRNGTHAPDLCSRRTFETDAIRAYQAVIAKVEAEQATAEVEAPAGQPAKVEAIPGNVGTLQRVSDPSHTVLALAATAHDEIVRQGGGLGYATRPQIRGLARKGYLTEIYEKDRSDARKVIEAGRITAKGLARLAELTKADAERARLDAAIAGTYSYAA